MPVSQRQAADEIDQAEQSDAQSRRQQQAGEDLVDALLRSGGVDDTAKPAAGDELAYDGADDGQSTRDAEACQNRRQGEGETQFPERLNSPGAVQAKQVHQRRIGRTIACPSKAYAARRALEG